MIEQHLDLETDDGAMNTFVTHPDEGGPFPVVFFYMDAPGKREELHDMARRIATTGYVVVLPNLYYRTTREFELGAKPEWGMQRMSELMFSVGNRMVAADTATMLRYVDDLDAADASRIGCVGYCMSGPFSLYVAGEYPDRIQAAASIYGVRLAVDKPDSPHLGLANTNAEIYVAAAEFDDYAPEDMVNAYEAALADSGVTGRVEWYMGVHHGFAFPARDAYDKPAAERHWSRLHSLFHRNLGV